MCRLYMLTYKCCYKVVGSISGEVTAIFIFTALLNRGEILKNRIVPVGANSYLEN